MKTSKKCTAHNVTKHARTQQHCNNVRMQNIRLPISDLMFVYF